MTRRRGTRATPATVPAPTPSTAELASEANARLYAPLEGEDLPPTGPVRLRIKLPAEALSEAERGLVRLAAREAADSLEARRQAERDLAARSEGATHVQRGSRPDTVDLYWRPSRLGPGLACRAVRRDDNRSESWIVWHGGLPEHAVPL